MISLNNRLVPDVPAGRGVPPGVHAGAVGAGEAEGAAHAAGSRRGRPGLQPGCGGTGFFPTLCVRSTLREWLNVRVTVWPLCAAAQLCERSDGPWKKRLGQRGGGLRTTGESQTVVFVLTDGSSTLERHRFVVAGIRSQHQWLHVKLKSDFSPSFCQNVDMDS